MLLGDERESFSFFQKVQLERQVSPRFSRQNRVVATVPAEPLNFNSFSSANCAATMLTKFRSTLVVILQLPANFIPPALQIYVLTAV